MRQLPPLNALKAFESAARLGGAKAACEELNVSQSAVSHHIAKLEDYLQVKLFHRIKNRIILTDTGHNFLRKIEPALNEISNATKDVAKFSNWETLTVSIPPSFTVNWLMPRLEGFLVKNPKINLRLIDKMSIDNKDTEIDCAIEYRQQPSSDLDSTLIFTDQVVAMASPRYIIDHNIKSIDDLKGCTLIETERRLVSWKSILTKKEWFKTQRFISVGFSLHALSAAEYGLGVALANRYNAQHLINANKIQIPFEFIDATLPATPRYYLSSIPQNTFLPKVIAFKKWLKSEF